jgi:hypothetical protein
MNATLMLMLAAAGIGSMHTIAPDHWVAFAALARAERWSASRTALITTLCGLGHVTVSVLLGLASVWFGLEVLQTLGTHLGSAAGLLAIAFGTTYGLWGLHRAIGSRWHSHEPDHVHWHAHHHGMQHHHNADSPALRVTPWTLFVLFSADPCVAVIPLIFAAAPSGRGTILAVVLAYEIATVATMVVLVLPARAAAGALRGAWAERFGAAIAGGVIALVGLFVMRAGL